jgi:5-methylcytosine-specific restriction endonuclease McrA
MKVDLHELLSHNGYTLGRNKNIRRKTFREILAETPPEKIQEAVAGAKSYHAVSAALGSRRNINRDEAKDLEQYCNHLGIDCSHIQWKSKKNGGRARIDQNLLPEDVIAEFFSDSPEKKVSRATLLRLIRDHNLLPKQCSECGISAKWNGIPLTLHVDHINGVNTDNRLENLRYLCPNCHTQTDTYAGRNKKMLSAMELALAKKV